MSKKGIFAWKLYQTNFMSQVSNEEETLYIYKSFVTDEAIDAINISLYQSNWKEILKCENVNEAYTTFLDKFYQLYDNFSLIKKIKIKFNSLKSPWITLGIKQTAKSKQRLYNKFLKNRSTKNEREYKGYKILFETIKKLSKKLYFSIDIKLTSRRIGKLQN